MKCISVQIQPKRNTDHTPEELIALSKSIGRYPEVDIDESGDYINLNFFTEDARLFWQEYREKVVEDKTLSSWIKDVALIVCEGNQGWDDYLLLFHYEQDQLLDEL